MLLKGGDQPFKELEWDLDASHLDPVIVLLDSLGRGASILTN